MHELVFSLQFDNNNPLSLSGTVLCVKHYVQESYHKKCIKEKGKIRNHLKFHAEFSSMVSQYINTKKISMKIQKIVIPIVFRIVVQPP